MAYKPEWEFATIKTYNGIYETTGNDAVWCGYEFVVYAEREMGNDAIYGIFGYGNTEEEAMQDAKGKVKEC